MTAYRNVFPKRHTLLVVIHAENEEQALRNVAIAHENGSDGVFLINHSISVAELIQIYEGAHMHFPSFWIGLNFLNQDPVSALARAPDTTPGLWVDDAGIRANGNCSGARDFLIYREREREWKGVYFGGVAFKYQEHISDAAYAARLAIPFMDVITTSGEGTGSAPDIGKIRSMREAVNDHPLAIASGITPENVYDYLPYADCFLVATGISDTFTELNPGRVRMLVDAIS